MKIFLAGGRIQTNPPAMTFRYISTPHLYGTCKLFIIGESWRKVLSNYQMTVSERESVKCDHRQTLPREMRLGKQCKE